MVMLKSNQLSINARFMNKKGMPYVGQRQQITPPRRQRRQITSPRRKVTSLHRRIVHTPQDPLSLDNAAGSSTAIAWKHTCTLSTHDNARRCCSLASRLGFDDTSLSHV